MEKLKILKGVGKQCPEPCSKDNGYLSIEDSAGVPHVVYRTFTGIVMFKGILNK